MDKKGLQTLSNQPKDSSEKQLPSPSKEQENLFNTLGNQEQRIDKILESMEDFITIENVEMNGYEGIKFCISLPEQGNFPGFKSEFFLQKAGYLGNLLQNDQIYDDNNLMDNIPTFDDIGKIEGVMRDYLKERGVYIDEGVNYDEFMRSEYRAKTSKSTPYVARTCWNKLINKISERNNISIPDSYIWIKSSVNNILFRFNVRDGKYSEPDQFYNRARLCRKL